MIQVVSGWHRNDKTGPEVPQARTGGQKSLCAGVGWPPEAAGGCWGRGAGRGKA